MLANVQTLYAFFQLLGVGEETYVREVTMIDSAKQSFEMTSTK